MRHFPETLQYSLALLASDTHSVLGREDTGDSVEGVHPGGSSEVIRPDNILRQGIN